MKWRTPWWHEKQPASQSSNGYHPKRRCLRQWHAVLGARTEKDAWKVSPFETHSFNRLFWHHDTLFLCDGDNHRIVSWKAGDTTFLSVAGEGAAVTGFNQLSGSPLLWWEISTHSFQNTVGKLVLETRWIHDLCCSPNGTFYVLQADGRRVQSWLIPSSSLSSAVSNFQRISNLLVGPFVCRKRRSFFIHRSTRSGRILRFNCLGLLWYGLFSIGRFFVTHGERFFVPKKVVEREDSSCACWWKALPGQKLEGVDFKIRSRCKMSAV